MMEILNRAIVIFRNVLTTDVRVIASAFVAIGILHICATLAAPHLVESSAFRRLSGELPLHEMKILPPVTASSQPTSFLSADARYAMCRFDSSQGPITVEAKLPARGWTLSIHTPQGDNVYTAVGQDANETIVSLQVVASTTSFSGLTPQSLGRSLSSDPQEIVEAPAGLAILRAPDRGKAYERNAILSMRSATCFPTKKK